MGYNIDLDVEYVYLVNDDLKMSCGKIASQVSHVAMLMQRWFNNEFSKNTVIGKAIILKASDSLIKNIVNNPMNPIYYVCEGDAGLTEVEKGSITCIGFIREANTKLDLLTRKLKLM